MALDGRALSGTTGAVLDPIVSLRQRIRLAPGGFVRHLVRDRHGLEPRGRAGDRAEVPRPERRARTFALAFTQAQSTLRHLGISSDEAMLYERLASRVLHTDASLRAGPDVLARNVLGQPGLWAHGISGDLPILLVRVVEENDIPLVRQVLQAQEYWRLKGLSADVVILNEHPVSYLDEMHVQLAALLDTGPWGAWKHRPGGVFLLRGDRMSEAERTPPRRRGAGDPERRARRARQPARPALRGAAVATGTADATARARAGARRASRSTSPGTDPRQRVRRLRRRRAGVCHRARRRPGNAAALGQRHRQSGLRHRRLGLGLGVHLGREQPREPAHAIRE